MTPLRVCIDAVTFAAPGVEDWDALRVVLSQQEPHPLGNSPTLPTNGETVSQTVESWRAKPDCLKPRAARRLSPQILLALSIAERVAPALSPEAAWVFASSIGEGETLQIILEALREPDMMVQPLRFQNAVHNAASGQWTIAAGLTGPATSIGAYAETVGAGFLKAAMQVVLENRAVGLVFYDVPLPDPLDAIHPLGIPIGAGFALSPELGANTLAVLEVTTGSGAPTAPVTDAARAMIGTLNPIAAVLPLLERLAGIGEGEVRLGLHGGSALTLKVTPA